MKHDPKWHTEIYNNEGLGGKMINLHLEVCTPILVHSQT